MLLRSVSKPPCIVLRCAFLAGTPGLKRYKTLKELKQKLKTLKFPHRAPQKVDNKRSRGGDSNSKSPVHEHRPPLLLERSEKTCCILLTKPVEHILIRSVVWNEVWQHGWILKKGFLIPNGTTQVGVIWYRL